MSAEERMLEAVLQYLGRRLGPKAMLRELRIDVVGSDGLRQEIRIRSTQRPTSADDDDESEPTPIRQAILEVLADADGPVKGSVIARRAGRTYSGTFRATLAAMVREGVLSLGTAGYEAVEE